MVVVERTGVVNDVPVPSEVPPVGAAYQLIVPEEAVAPRVSVPDPHREAGVVPVMVGLALTVTVCVTEFVQSTTTPPMVYVIVAVPAVKPVTRPVDAFTVATAGEPLDQTPPLVASASWVVEPAQSVRVPVIAAGAVGSAVMVIVRVALAAGEPLDVRVKITVPE